MADRIAWRPLWIASGSLLAPSSRAMSDSLGRARIWARKACSSPSSAAMASSASQNVASHSTGFPAPAALAAAVRLGRARSVIACQRAKRSLSWRAMCARSPGDWLKCRATGAEKPRLRDTTGRAPMPEKTKVWLRSVRCRTSPLTSPPATEAGCNSAPFSPISANLSGMCIGSLAV